MIDCAHVEWDLGIGWIGGLGEVTFPGKDALHGEDALRTSTLYVSSGYFSTLEVALFRGPGFNETMHDPLNAQPAVILGYNFWQNRLSADPKKRFPGTWSFRNKP